MKIKRPRDHGSEIAHNIYLDQCVDLPLSSYAWGFRVPGGEATNPHGHPEASLPARRIPDCVATAPKDTPRYSPPKQRGQG